MMALMWRLARSPFAPLSGLLGLLDGPCCQPPHDRQKGVGRVSCFLRLNLFQAETVVRLVTDKQVFEVRLAADPADDNSVLATVWRCGGADYWLIDFHGTARAVSGREKV